MSKQKKSAGKFAAKKKSNKGLVVAIVILTILVLGAAAVLLINGKADEPVPIVNTTETKTATETTQSQMNLPEVNSSVNLGYGIYVTEIGSYTGMYMEDGSDEVLSNILMLVVKNEGEQDIQYAEITMDLGDQQASFSMTTLPVGESMVLLEKNRMEWDAAVDYSAILPKADNIAYFQDSISTLEDQLKIQITDGAINVTNISGADIAGNITVYYKNAAEDLLYGGITYRVTIEGGLKSNEIRQVMTNHASDTGSRIMFATISE